jgi:hypothetical protein
MPRPCDADENTGACPWRVDAEPGEFEAARFEQLAATVGTDEHDAPVSAHLFACHSTGKGGTVASRDVACAGALRVAGHRHVGVRMMIATGQLPVEVLGVRDDEPELFGSYDEMATQQAAGVYRRSAADVWRAYAGFGPLAGRPGFEPLRRELGACSTDGVALSEDVEERGSAGPDTLRSLTPEDDLDRPGAGGGYRHAEAITWTGG